MLELTDKEKSIIQTLPGCLTSLADWHETQEAEADAMGFDISAKHHFERAIELRKEAKAILDEWEN